MFDCILLIAGKGKRSRLDYNKVFYLINNKPLYIYPLETFLSLEECARVIIVCSASELFEVQEHTKSFDRDRIKIVIGGLHRQDSVYEGMKHTKSNKVLIHDGARVLVRKNDILQVYQEVSKQQAAVLGVPAKDTIKEVYADVVVQTLDREKLMQIQTPQGVMRHVFFAAIQQARKENFYGSDDVSIMEKYTNSKVKVIKGSTKNFKITTPEDIEYINYLLKEQE